MKNNKKIFFRCITEKIKGYGNFKRSLILAKYLRNRNFTPYFIINKNPVIEKELNKQKFFYHHISKSKSLLNESKLIKHILQINNSKIIILDMREKGEKLSKHLKEKKMHVILLDDAWCNKAYSDLIINGTLPKQFHKYKIINQSTKLFLGTQYYLTEQEFITNRKSISEIENKNKYKIVISLGGSDSFNLTPLILQSLSELEKLNLIIIVGPFFSNLRTINRQIKNKKNITMLIAPKDIWKIFRKADLVISNAGNTLYDLALMRIPTICIPTVSHQEVYAKEFESMGFCINLGKPWTITKLKIQNTVQSLLNNTNKRKEMWHFADRIMDKKCNSNVLKTITQYLNNT